MWRNEVKPANSPSHIRLNMFAVDAIDSTHKHTHTHSEQSEWASHWTLFPSHRIACCRGYCAYCTDIYAIIRVAYQLPYPNRRAPTTAAMSMAMVTTSNRSSHIISQRNIRDVYSHKLLSMCHINATFHQCYSSHYHIINSKINYVQSNRINDDGDAPNDDDGNCQLANIDLPIWEESPLMTSCMVTVAHSNWSCLIGRVCLSVCLCALVWINKLHVLSSRKQLTNNSSGCHMQCHEYRKCSSFARPTFQDTPNIRWQHSHTFATVGFGCKLFHIWNFWSAWNEKKYDEKAKNHAGEVKKKKKKNKKRRRNRKWKIDHQVIVRFTVFNELVFRISLNIQHDQKFNRFLLTGLFADRFFISQSLPAITIANTGSAAQCQHTVASCDSHDQSLL